MNYLVSCNYLGLLCNGLTGVLLLHIKQIIIRKVYHILGLVTMKIWFHHQESLSITGKDVLSHTSGIIINLFFPRPAKTSPFVTLLCLSPLPLGGKWLTGWLICPPLFLKPSTSRPDKTVPFVILLCLTPGDCTCQGRASCRVMVNWAYDYTHLYSLTPSPSRLDKTAPFVILLCLKPGYFSAIMSFCDWYVDMQICCF